MTLEFGNVLVILCTLTAVTLGLDNGLARLPPMGWVSGERFGCNVDCVNYPDDCLSEHLIKSQADKMVDRGYRDLGYQSVLLSDCWQAVNRSKSGQLQPDPKRFPSGIRALADYLHARKLKLGLYTSAGHFSQSGRPGSKDNYQRDTQTFAQWGVDMVSLDGFNVSKHYDIASDFKDFGRFLNKTGRHILYACDWPLYEFMRGRTPNYKDVSRTCNTFRSHKKMGDGWPPLEDIMKWFGKNSHNISAYAGPGSWNDPDELLVGDFGLSEDQQKMQMAIWAMLSAPLFLSVDLRNIPGVSAKILTNRYLLAINQDHLGDQARIIAVKGQMYIWRKRIRPRGSFALMFIYVSISGGPSRVAEKLADLGLVTAEQYAVTDSMTGQPMGMFKPWYTFNCEVNPTGVRIFTAVART